LNIGGSRSGNQDGSRPIVSAVEGLPGGLLRPGISPQRGACLLPVELLGRRIRVFVGLTNAVAAEKKDLGVLYESVGYRGSDRGVV
jgi:hypothetical protein